MKTWRFTIAIALLGIVLPWFGFPQRAAAQDEQHWDHVRVHAPRQTVEVTRRAGSFTAEFQNEVIVYPNGRAIGSLSITGRGGALVRFHVVAGRVRLSGGEVAEVRLLLRKAGADPGDDFDLAVVRPEPAPSQDCLIYDFVGPPAREAHFEAEGRIEVIRF